MILQDKQGNQDILGKKYFYDSINGNFEPSEKKFQSLTFVNSEYDEFRPVSIENKIMIFSSNRPSGKGGYDLYIVRIDNEKIATCWQQVEVSQWN